MTLEFKLGAQAVDGVAAAVLAVAVAFAAGALGTLALAALLAPPSFVLAYALLARVADQRVHRLAAFELQGLDPPRPSPEAVDDGKVVDLFGPRQPAIARSAPTADVGVGGDAGRALSEALAELSRSLR